MSGTFVPADVIRAKRDGRTLRGEDIRRFVQGFVEGEVADYQMSAFLMAVLLRGLDGRERTDLTLAMRDSGRLLRWDGLDRPTVDKHSTGGVGDGVSLSLAPLVASCGVAVPMMSGRGLGHTGGTLDKLEAIPGFRVRLAAEEIADILRRTGACLFGQTEDIVPADRRMYALRDVTATVESVDLITASIMSKKLAEGTAALVLDVKTGRGAFMKRLPDALRLARAMVEVGRRAGLAVSAFVTDMDLPLGHSVGNALEVEEHIALLRGRIGPDGASAELLELDLVLGAEMLRLAGVVRDRDEGRRCVRHALDSGAGLAKFREIVEAQGGDPAVVDRPELLPRAPLSGVVRAERDGFLTDMEPETVGRAALLLGAGRLRAEDAVDPGAGLRLHRRVGDRVRKGEPVATAYASDSGRLEAGLETFRAALRYGPVRRRRRPLVLRSVT